MTKTRVTWWGVAFLVAAVGLISCDGSSSPDADVSGTWLGSLTVSGAPLRVVLNLTADAKGTLDVPEQGLIGQPLSQVDVTGRHLVVQVTDLGARYEGDVAQDGQSIAGTFHQQTTSVPLAFEKQPGPLDYRRPQDPVAPYPYHSEDVTFSNAAAGVTLAGTLTWPEGNGPFKTVVLIAGSGPNDRNEEVLNHRPFLVLSDALTRAGIATLRYDKRGVDDSSGNYDTATSLDFAADARAAVDYVRAQDHFTASSVGLVGHSEGGLLAPMAAADNPAVAYLVMLAGPGVPGGEILISQDRAIAAANGTPASSLDANEALERQVFACFQNTSDPVELEKQIRAVLTTAGVPKAEQDALVAQVNTPWMRFFVTYDPAPVLTRTTIPVLALNGSLDLQVLPDLNLPPIEAALAGNDQATVDELDGLNHFFQHATTGSPNEYAVIDETMAPEVLSQVSAWIAAR
jgi:pimeloyl-ACP methyl ester carboxylesterase